MTALTSALQAYAAAAPTFDADEDGLIVSVHFELANGARVVVTRQDVADAREYGLIAS